MNTIDLHQQIALTLLNKTGKKRMRTILSHTQTVEAFFSESKYNLSKIPGIGKKTIESIDRNKALKEAEQYLSLIERENIHAVFFQDKEFPHKLNQCEDGPLLLFYKGNINLNPGKTVAIVGTRNASEYGKKLCEELIMSLKQQEITVISGLAYGVDIFVHELCLRYNLPTIGVLGHGLDMIYPAIHKATSERMMNNGGILTEFLPGTSLDRMNFPMRNRIIAGLCDATIVIESGEKGGSLITAELANDYNREVFAFPGNIDSKYSKGCNRLIQQNKAHLISSGADFLQLMGWQQEEGAQLRIPDVAVSEDNPPLTKTEEKLISYLKERTEVTAEWLAAKSNINAGEINFSLLNLEFLGLIKSLPGYKYRLAVS